MNGQLSSKGFKLITFRYKVDHHLMLGTFVILYKNGQNAEVFIWDQEPTRHETDRYETSVELEIGVCLWRKTLGPLH